MYCPFFHERIAFDTLTKFEGVTAALAARFCPHYSIIFLTGRSTAHSALV